MVKFLLNIGRFDLYRSSSYEWDGMGMGRRTDCIYLRRSGPRYLSRILPLLLNTFFPALMINLLGLAVSTIVFVIEIMFHKTNKR